jgi:cell division protein ZapA
VSGAERKTEVEIFGERYTLRAGEDPDYLRRVSEYVDEKFRDAARENPALAPSKIAVLASLNIADELFKQREAVRGLEQTVLGRLDGLVTLLDGGGRAPEA